MPILEIVGTNRVVPTQETLRRLKQGAAKNGVVLGPIKNREQYRDALVESTDLATLDQVHQQLFGYGLPSEEEILAELHRQGLDEAAIEALDPEQLNAVCQKLIEAKRPDSQ